ncbi:Arm DNA-binding domain-containing protein [Nitrosospira briensis]|uniref:Arm DNA-binding domain-containing protein n=1 Tax=Nitrosospira briensis TaxID=35799 RepID=UPI000943A2DF|nr:Arm DNA-binding domain-containing protein [Nitrosospira briensis]
MAKVKFTAGRLQSFQCRPGTAQAFLWCEEVHGLGVRATANSPRKRYIFQSKVKGQSIRVTIGDVSAWSIAKAQAEARRLQVLIDQGQDPRQVEADREAAEEAKAAAMKSEKESQSVTVVDAWNAYTAERRASKKDGKPEWGERHLGHLRYFLQEGGVKRTRGSPTERAGGNPSRHPGAFYDNASCRY